MNAVRKNCPGFDQNIEKVVALARTLDTCYIYFIAK